MTHQERIERAARAAYELRMAVWEVDGHWEAVAETNKVKWRDLAAKWLAAAYPELHGDSPSHWLAPREATPGMTAAGAKARWRSAIRDANNVWEIYAAMRDAYLADKGPA